MLKLVNLPAERLRDHADGFRKANMARKRAVRNAPLKRFHRKANALLLHNGRAEGGEAVYAAALHGFDIRHAACEADGKQVHHQARVDARTQDGNAVRLCKAIHFCGKLRLLGFRVAHFLRGGDDVHALFHNELDLREHLCGEGIRCDDADVALFL